MGAIGRSWLDSGLLGAFLVLSSVAALGQPDAAQPTPLVISIDENADSFGGRWVKRIYTEAFKRLNIPIETRPLPMARRAAMADAGTIDIEPGRVAEYGAVHPNLIRVEEPVMNFGFGLYTANPTLRIQRLEDLISSGLLAEYRQVVLHCDNVLKPLLPPSHLSNAPNALLGIRKLLAKRTDIYCELDYVVYETLDNPEFKDVARIRKVLSLGDLASYPYVHKKHADLVPLLAATLKQMKAEGLVDTYRMQVEQELGWKH